MKSADDSEALAGLAAGLVSGLKALHVFSNTGQGRRMPAAREPVQAAWRAREELLSAAQRQQFEGFASSRNFAALLEEKSPSPEPVRRDYVPAPRQQPQPRERKQKRQVVEPEAGSGEEGQPPALSKRQLRRLQAAQRAEAAAAEEAAARQRQLEEAARQAAAAEARRKAAEEEAANRTYKLTIKLGTSALPAEHAAHALAPAQQQQGQPAAADTALAAALDDHWRWHQQQQAATAQPQPEAEEAPPLPPEDEPGGWQAVPSPLDAPLSPMSAPASPTAPAAAVVTANGSGAGAGLGLNPEALEHAASGSPAVRELLG